MSRAQDERLWIFILHVDSTERIGASPSLELVDTSLAASALELRIADGLSSAGTTNTTPISTTHIFISPL